MNVLKQRSFALTRVLLVMMLVAVSLASLPALADPPPWQTGPNTTYQTWIWDDDNGKWVLGSWFSNPTLKEEPTASYDPSTGVTKWWCPNFRQNVAKRIRIELPGITNFDWQKVQIKDAESGDRATLLGGKRDWAEWQMRRCWPFYVEIPWSPNQPPPLGGRVQIFTQCVPEPGTLLLSTIGFGVVGAALRRRRKV